MTSNDTIPTEVVVQHLRNWNFSWNIILTVLIIVLQYGHYKYSKFLYAVKMAILWALWPLVIALSIFDAWANAYTNWWYFGFSIAMLVTTLVLWVFYFVNSFRLYRRTRTFWAFNPETDAIIVISVFGRNYSIPIIKAPTGITLTLLSGTLLVDGIRIATGVQYNQLPNFVTVAKATTTIVYHRMGRSLSSNSNTGWAFYVRSKQGDYSAVSNPNDEMTESERLLHLV
ncbi:membrane protein [Bat alphacoronavirus]|uniref:Membrane protein n=1 Tax=bat alphacoronavirus isolate AMA_L_F TaxID=3070181 RepID=A0AA48V828_9ALPC|nr:membrane protein [Bat alphacoronavirus]QLE11828.1 membrane protein [bat alphacoronavirus isolate AMA_L_F]QTE76075.1 membrane protein [Bat coronavirus]